MKEQFLNKFWQRRRSVFNFDKDEKIDLIKFNNVITIFSKNMPSKQSVYPYQIDIFNWKNIEFRKYVYSVTLADNIFPNPQVLSPILITFTTNDDWQGFVEIGMAAMGLTQLLNAHGFCVGFCGCINKPQELAEKIINKTGHYTPLLLCVGATNYVNNPVSVDPYTHKLLPAKINEKTSKKPKIINHINKIY